MKSPTLNKVEDLAGTMEIRPLTLLTLAYLTVPSVDSPVELMGRISAELNSLRNR
jgi:hypothetical protein